MSRKVKKEGRGWNDRLTRRSRPADRRRCGGVGGNGACFVCGISGFGSGAQSEEEG